MLFGNRIFADIIIMSLLEWILIQYDWYPYKRKRFRPRNTCREISVQRWRLRSRWCFNWTKNARDCQDITRNWRTCGTDFSATAPRRDQLVRHMLIELWDDNFSVTQLCPLFVTAWTVAHLAPLSMEFSRQESWSGLSFPIPGDLPDPEIELTSLVSPALAGSATWES